jgi:hypothetical protein
MSTEIRVPTLGESVTEATIGQWFKKVGDTVNADEPIVELETDKVTIEVPAPASGVLEAISAARRHRRRFRCRGFRPQGRSQERSAGQQCRRSRRDQA